MSISRSGILASHYRNGMAVATTCSVGGLIDPETCNEDLTIGVRMSKDDEYFHGRMWNLRLWDRALSPFEIREIFETERHWFGV